MLQPQRITLDVTGRQGTLFLNRPDQHNALDGTFVDQLIDGLQELEANPAVRVIVLAARGKSFCAGGDLAWMKHQVEAGKEANLAACSKLGDLLGRLNRISKPTIARVHGPAHGMGIGIIAACDISIATFPSYFSLAETRLGLSPSVLAPYLIAAVGMREARRYLLTAERFSALEAYRIGLLHEVVMTDEDLDEALDEWVNALCANSPTAIGHCKELIALLAGRQVDDALAAKMAEFLAQASASAEGKEGVAAFLEKRQPVFAVPGIGIHSTVQ